MDEIRLDSKVSDQKVPGRDKLWVQVLIGMFCLAAVFALAAGAVLHQLESTHLRSNAEQENLTKFELLQSSLVENVVSEDLPQLETTLNRLIQRDPDLHAVEVTNESGQVLYAWRRESNSVQPRGLFGGELDPELQVLSGDFDYSGETFGRVTAVWNLVRTQIQSDRHGRILILFTLVVCSLLGLFAYILVNLLAVNPINRISRRLGRFRKGDFEPKERLPRFVSGELRRLDRSADDLAGFLVEREQHAQELSTAKVAAESSSRAKSRFLAMMSHELRTPLNAINGFSEIIAAELQGPVGSATYKDYAQQIHEAGNHLLAVINDILDISKIESGDTDLVREPVDLKPVIETAIRLVADPKGLHELEIDRQFVSGLPIVLVDERRFRQVMINLISNAVKFTPKGGRVVVSAEWNQERGLAITVSDTGIGIAPEDLERVVEPFNQIENVFSRRHEGTGLGLAVARALVELHGGKLELHSKLGRGTTVHLSFPPALAADVGTNGESAAAPLSGTAKIA